MGGQLGALGARLRSPRLWCPPPGCRGPLGGGAGPPPPWPASGRPRAGGGRGGGEGGGRGSSPHSPPGPLAPPPGGGGGGGPVVPVPGGQPQTEGPHSSPAPLHPLGARPSCRSSLGPPAPLAAAAWCLLAGGGGGGGRASAGGGGSGHRLAFSRLRGSGPPPALVALALSPTGAGVRPAAASYLLGEWGSRSGSGGPALPWGASRGTVPSPPPRAHRLGRRGAAVTCVVACTGAGAVAAARSARGSASG